MTNIMRVTAKRLFNDKFFYLASIITFAISLLIALTNAPVMAEWAKDGDATWLENCYFNFAPLIGIVYASFVSLFLGVEHSDGTLRNKIIAGHSRTSVVLSLFTISALACLIITLIWAVAGLSGLVWLDFSFSWGHYALLMVISACGAIWFAALFTVISMLVPNKALGAVISLVLWFVLLFGCSIICNSLSAPEMIYDYVMQNGAYVPTNPQPNPNYISGITRTVFETITHICPVCQAINFSSDVVTDSVFDIIGTIASTAVLLLGGCIIFNKRDLK